MDIFFSQVVPDNMTIITSRNKRLTIWQKLNRGGITFMFANSFSFA